MLAGIFFTYTFGQLSHVNEFLAVYTIAPVPGASDFQHKRGGIRFYDGNTWLMQIVLFITLWLLAFPSQLLRNAGAGIITALFLIFRRAKFQRGPLRAAEPDAGEADAHRVLDGAARRCSYRCCFVSTNCRPAARWRHLQPSHLYLCCERAAGRHDASVRGPLAWHAEDEAVQKTGVLPEDLGIHQGRTAARKIFFGEGARVRNTGMETTVRR